MNIRNTIDNLKKPFNKGAKWEKFAPVWDKVINDRQIDLINETSFDENITKKSTYFQGNPIIGSLYWSQRPIIFPSPPYSSTYYFTTIHF
jgi:hypothetical protein